VPELSHYLDRVEIYAPIRHGQLAIYPVRRRDGDALTGDWLTMADAVARGVLIIDEKSGGGQVPWVRVENRSRRQQVMILAGELLSGGKQTRTVRQDAALTPGQIIDLPVFCVEERRWKGDDRFEISDSSLPQSIHRALQDGADQKRIWAEVARNNAALDAENASGSLDIALQQRRVRTRLAEVRGKVLPELPKDTIGFIFVVGDRGVGADFFGQHELARRIFPKLLDSYAVDYLVKREVIQGDAARAPDGAAIGLLQQIQAAGSRHVPTPGSGTGIRLYGSSLGGAGVGLRNELVHLGVQTGPPIYRYPRPPRVRPPRPRPNEIYPRGNSPERASSTR
jgi:hypothetical protein